MTIASMFAMFLAMVVMAAIPGPGVLAVVARSMSSGVQSGVATVVGIVCGDYVFILLSVFGLSAIAAAMGSLFVIVKYIGAAYLIWLGLSILRSKVGPQEIRKEGNASFFANFSVGLATTLGNPKAILFYLGFFPAFLDLSRISIELLGVILLTATVSVGGVMLGYAYMAGKLGALLKSRRTKRRMNLAAGSLLIGSGTFLAAKS